MFADGHAEIAVEGLRDDVDGLAASLAGVGVGCGAGELGHKDRPAHEPGKLDECGENTERRRDDQERWIGVGNGAG